AVRSRLRGGVLVLVSGLFTAVVCGLAGAAMLHNERQPELGVVGTLETLSAAVAGGPSRYHAVTERASWFLETLPVVSYALIIVALTQLLRPVLAPRAAASQPERPYGPLHDLGSLLISSL